MLVEVHKMLPLNMLRQENTLESQQLKLISSIRVYAHKRSLTEIEANNKVTWILRFLRFHNKQHPVNLNHTDIETFLSSLATEHNYDESIQINAISALTFLYEDFLQIKLDDFNYVRTKVRRGFLDRYGNSKCRSVLEHMQGTSLLMAELIVSGKLKLKEVINLKIADINIKKNRIHIRSNDEVIKYTLNIPIHLILNLRIQMMRVRQLVQIKTQQFSNNIQHKNNELYSSSELNVIAKNNEYLFPVANAENPHISSKSMQLALLKNDIQIAVKQYLRFSNHTTAINYKHKKAFQISEHIVDRYIDLKATREFEPLSLASYKKNISQTSFKFTSKVKSQEKLELGAA